MSDAENPETGEGSRTVENIEKLVAVSHPTTGERLWVPTSCLRPGWVAIVDRPLTYPFSRWAISPSGYRMDAEVYRLKTCVMGVLSYPNQRNV